MTSGRARRDKDGVWKYPQYIENHHPTRRARGTRTQDKDEWPSAPWIKAVRIRRRELGWSVVNLEARSGVTRGSFMLDKMPLRENVVRVAEALDMPVDEALVSCEYEVPSSIGWKLLRRMIQGETLQAIATRARVSESVVRRHLNHPARWRLKPRVLTRLSRVLQLTPEEIAAVRAEQPYPKIWEPENRDRALRINRGTAKKITIPVDIEKAKADLAAGKTLEEIAESQYVSPYTMRDRLIRAEVITGRVRSRSAAERRHERQRKPLAKEAEEKQAHARKAMQETWDTLKASGRTPSQTILVKEYGFKRTAVKSWREGLST